MTRFDDGVTWLRASQVAELFHVNDKTISRWSRDGKLPHVRTLGGHRRYEEARIRALVAELTAGFDPDTPVSVGVREEVVVARDPQRPWRTLTGGGDTTV